MKNKSFYFALYILFVTIVLHTCGCFTKHTNLDSNELKKINKPFPNIILITISTLRADHVGSFGYTRDTTPHFDNFCKGAVLFRNAFATSGWTMPAHGSLFTSLYPGTHGATHINNSLNPQYSTLAEILRDNGYYCAGFCSNPRLDRKHGFAQGFDVYDDYSVSAILNSMIFKNEGSIDINKQRTNNLINDLAIRWLQNNSRKPFFLFIHYYDNHWDYLPPAPYDKFCDPNYQGAIDGTNIAKEPLFSNSPSDRDIQHIISLYDGEIRQTDEDLGEVLNFLRVKGHLTNSLVVILGDHGEQFYEHGHTSHHGVYEELIHIPLAITVPNSKAQGKIVDCLVSQVDILPTILDYLRIPIPKVCQGKSLRPLIDGKMTIVNNVVFSEYTGGTIVDCYCDQSIQYKYCELDNDSFGFDLLKDPYEQQKIYSKNFPNEITFLSKILKQYRQSSSADE